jgi:polyphosphate kinase 2 (PPK2 family)
MATKKDKHHDEEVRVSPAAARQEAGAGQPRKLKRKAYEREMRLLQGELVALQEWVKASGAKICIVFEGRDTAGKGGTIKRITERVSPRVFRVVALPAPTEREESQMYIQRYGVGAHPHGPSWPVAPDYGRGTSLASRPRVSLACSQRSRTRSAAGAVDVSG